MAEPRKHESLLDRWRAGDEEAARQLLSRLNEQERQVLVMHMEGYSAEEIAQRLQTFVRKVYRILERIRGLAEQEGPEGGAGKLAPLRRPPSTDGAAVALKRKPPS
jgi:DNA-directed RNA polymerase specialized sigma24 family protein